MGIITPFEFRHWLVTSFGLPLDSRHPQEQQQMQAMPQAVQGGGLEQGMQSPDIEGLSANGKPMPSQMQEGGVV